MGNQIELMDIRRRRLLFFFLIGYGVWYGLLNVYGTIQGFIRIFSDYRNPINQFINKPAEIIYYSTGALLGLVFIVFLFRWWSYKRNLKKDPEVQSAVNDELVKQNWLKAYRLSFFFTVTLLVLFQINRILDSFVFMGKLGFIDGLAIHYLLYVIVMSCVGGFLYYSRER